MKTVEDIMKSMGYEKGTFWMKPGTSKDKYQATWIKEGKRTFRTVYVHRIVWEYYNGPIPKGHVIHHIDHDTTNNHISNLQCCTRAEHSIIHGFGSNGVKRTVHYKGKEYRTLYFLETELNAPGLSDLYCKIKRKGRKSWKPASNSSEENKRNLRILQEVLINGEKVSLKPRTQE